MVKINSSMNRIHIYMCKNVLENYGIECTIKNDNISFFAGELPVDKVWIELWIIDDAREEEAKKILDESINSEDEITEISWHCPKCKAENEGQFTECWQCGYSRIE